MALSLPNLPSGPGWRLPRWPGWSRLPREGRDIAATKIADYSPKFASLPFVIGQRWVGDLTTDKAIWFDSLLMPHGKELSATKAAEQIKVLHDDGKSVALQIRVGDETWTLVDNPDGSSLSADGLATDAQYLLSRSKPGAPDYLLAHQAKSVRVGSITHNWDVPVTVEIGGNN